MEQPPQCTDCGWNYAHNKENFYHISPPWEAFAIAWVGGHIWLREVRSCQTDLSSSLMSCQFVPAVGDGAQWKLVVITLFLAVMAMYYSGSLLHFAFTVFMKFIHSQLMSIGM